MRSPGAKFWTILTVAVGILTGVLVYTYLSALQAAKDDSSMVNVVVARVRIPRDTKISPEMIRVSQIPSKYVHPMAVNDPQDVVDRYATQEFWPGEPILKGQVASEKAANELPYKIPSGKRAITIAVNSVTGVAGHIKPGHYVDVLVSYQVSERVEDVRVSTVLQKVLVLAVGSDLQKKEGIQQAETVTLAVRPEEAQMLFMAESVGRIKLVLRPAGEDGELRLPTIDRRSLLMQP